ncbi:hypothetical protein KC343_g4704 [Hortaea werneckii]|nr:hypothetical protein KC338_g4420 [Hortaea werneckii]KAI6867577.1 hypothetical protein KC323_g3470 [Hortaea werneckii]KAI7349721.1 hypothetical protein KC320_g5923 [Hortaea werneckii]KAI7566179.1 hypothetical protein KC317_g5842 [Hortaea werneckii]KAI7620378.1 hypothetical protein KC346_g4149 [Hortaea werneckii]
MCRIVQYDYMPCGHQSAPSLQQCQQAVELNNAMCHDASEEDLPEIIIPLERFCPTCSQGQSHDFDLEEPTLHHHQAEAFPDAPTQADYGQLQGDEEDLDRLALQTALGASKLDVQEEDFREVMEATELEAEEYERRMMEEVLRISYEGMPGMGVWREQNDFLRRAKRGGLGQSRGIKEAGTERDDFATRLERLKGQSETARSPQSTIKTASKRSARRSEVEQSTPFAFASKPHSETKLKMDSVAPSAISNMKSVPQGGERTLRSMTDRGTVSTGGTAVPAPQNILRGPRNPPSPPRSPMEAAGDLEREEELRRAKYEKMKSGPEPDGMESVIGGDRMPGFEDLPRGNARPSIISDSVDENEENDGSDSGETETIRRLESRSSGSRFSRRPF